MNTIGVDSASNEAVIKRSEASRMINFFISLMSFIITIRRKKNNI